MWSSNYDKHCFLALSDTDSSSPPSLMSLLISGEADMAEDGNIQKT